MAPMTVAVASGKGGTGKTTVALGLALTAPGPACLLDCDVEAPNCHLFLHPGIREGVDVGIPIPSVDEGKCTACGACSRFCRFHAIAALKPAPLVFPELCHGCGGCVRVCPEGALREVPHPIGRVEEGARGDLRFVQGVLGVGHPMAPPLVRAVRRRAHGPWTVVDCPPGTSCPVAAAVRGCDFAVLVTDPTPFGLHDFSLAVRTLRGLGVPFAAVVNRAEPGQGQARELCGREGIPVLLEVPDDRRIAEAYARGEPVVEALPEYRQAFRGLWDAILGRAGRG